MNKKIIPISSNFCVNPAFLPLNLEKSYGMYCLSFSPSCIELEIAAFLGSESL